MPKNKIGDLRNLMFETIERLMDDDDQNMDAAKARAIADVGRIIVDTAKAEIALLKEVGAGPGSGSGFFDGAEQPKQIGASNGGGSNG